MVCSRILRVLLIVGLVALLVPVAFAQAQGSGEVVVRDGAGLSSAATISLTDVPDPPAGTVYEGWFITDDGVKDSTGILQVTSGSINQVLTADDAVQNLFGAYNKFVITIEPVPDPDPGPSGVVAYAREIPAGGLAHIRHLLHSWAPNPAYGTRLVIGPAVDSADVGIPKGIVVGLREQTEVALLHARLSQDRGAAGVLSGSNSVQQHACHVVNIIVGSEGADFDASCGNPGDGFGVLNYAVEAAKHSGFAALSAPGDPTIARFDAVVTATAKQIYDRDAGTGVAIQALEQALLAKGSSSLLTANLFINNAEGLLSNATETGAVTLAWATYIAAQDMGTFTIVEPPSVGERLIPQMAQWALMAGIVMLLLGIVLYTGTRLGTRTRRS